MLFIGMRRGRPYGRCRRSGLTSCVQISKTVLRSDSLANVSSAVFWLYNLYRMRSQIGIYSGTFDPVHQGHIAFAKEALRICKLDEVIFLPERQPRAKRQVTNISHRIALLKRATSHIAEFHVVNLAADQFTVQNSLPELRALFGRADLTFLMGSDVVKTFPYRWDGLSTLLHEVSFVVGTRTNDSSEEVVAIMKQMEQEYGLSIDYMCIHAPEAKLASSPIRNGTADTAWLPPATVGYIHKHGLYSWL